MKNAEPNGVARKRYRLTRSVNVRPHASGNWTWVLGKKLDEKQGRVVPKQFYHRGTEAAAQAEADRLLRKWQFVVQHWENNYQPNLKMLGSRFSHEPHWDAALGVRADAGASQPTAAEIAYQKRPPTPDEIGEAYGDVTLLGIFSLYEQERSIAAKQGDVRQMTIGTEAKNIRNALTYFADGFRASDLNAGALTEAKGKMLDAVSRRTALNYLSALRAMLAWFYGSDYGRWCGKPSNFDTVFRVSGAVRADVQIADAAMLKRLLTSASGRTRMYLMLALNCGMYQADIGRLEPHEVNIADGYVFWDRSKEPQNPFKVRHDLWAETLVLVKQFYQPTGDVAFVAENGKPLYVVGKSGAATDRVGKAYGQLAKQLKADGVSSVPSFHQLRKTTNQALIDLLHRQHAGDDTLIAISEISKEFLGQKTPMLARLYSTSNLRMYDRSNRYLKAVGEHYRREGIFDALASR